MSRTRKWLGTITVLAIIGLLATYFYALPAVVQNRVAAELANAGFADATFELTSVSFFRSEISNLKLSGDASLKRLIVTYTPFGVFSGTVRWLKVEGLELAVDSKDGHLSISVLDQWMAHREKPATQQATTRPP